MNRTVVITGASSGVGLAAAEQLAAQGDHVVAVGRDPDRLAAAVEKIKAAGGEPDAVRADFESLDDVRRLADHVLTTYPEIDVLANNAGGIVGGYRRTKDGHESTIQANHLGPFLLTHLLRDRLTGKRIVNTASEAHREGPPDPGNLAGDPGNYRAYRAYGQSKSANILFTSEAHRRWPEILSLAFHPGVVRSNFGAGRAMKLFYKYAPGLVPPEQAGALLVWLATAPADELVDGAYYVGHKTTEPKPHAADEALASRLWEASAEAVGL